MGPAGWPTMPSPAGLEFVLTGYYGPPRPATEHPATWGAPQRTFIVTQTNVP